MKNVGGRFAQLVLAALITCSCGCGSESADTASESDVKNLSDNLAKTIELTDEINFCVLEQAGEQTIGDLLKELVTTLESASSSIASSDLSSSEQSELEANVDKLKSASEQLLEGFDEANAAKFPKEASKLTKKMTKYIKPN